VLTVTVDRETVGQVFEPAALNNRRLGDDELIMNNFESNPNLLQEVAVEIVSLRALLYRKQQKKAEISTWM
jgi:hypothetical protein